MLTVIAKIRTCPGRHHRQAVLDQSTKTVPTVLEEKGRHGYTPTMDYAVSVSFRITTPDLTMMVEQWENIAHPETHLQTPHVKAYSETVRGDVLGVNTRILESGT